MIINTSECDIVDKPQDHTIRFFYRHPGFVSSSSTPSTVEIISETTGVSKNMIRVSNTTHWVNYKENVHADGDPHIFLHLPLKFYKTG